MLLWHGHQWGLGAGCAGRRLQRNTGRLSRQQGGDHRVLGRSGSRWCLGRHCGEGASRTAHVIIQMPFCAPNSKLMAAPSLVTLTLPPSCSTTEYPPDLRSHVHLCLHTHPCLAVAVSPEYATLLMSRQELWGLFRVTWFWVPGEGNGAEAKIPGRRHPVV